MGILTKLNLDFGAIFVKITPIMSETQSPRFFDQVTRVLREAQTNVRYGSLPNQGIVEKLVTKLDERYKEEPLDSSLAGYRSLVGKKENWLVGIKTKEGRKRVGFLQGYMSEENFVTISVMFFNGSTQASESFTSDQSIRWKLVE